MINDRYKIKKKLGSGRNQVYMCVDLLNSSKEIAIKIFSNITNNKELESFRNEYFLLRKLNHPNIVNAYDFGTILSIEKDNVFETEITEGSKFFTVDCIEGETLDKYGGCDKQILNNIIEQICSALYYLHQSNYIYYNLQLENILIKNGHDTPRVYLYNFRFTKHIPNNEPLEVHGSPHYIAPEILKIEKADHKADLYSLGIVLYYLIYNRFPFATDDELNIYKANIENDFEFPRKDNFDKLINITKNLLHKSPDLRYNTTLQILEELQLPLSSYMKNNWKPVKNFCGRKKEVYDINSIIYNKTTREVVLVRGEEGSGKSSLLEEINYNHHNSILINTSNVDFAEGIWKKLLRDIFYSEMVYQNIDFSVKNEIKNLLINESTQLTEKLKSLFLRITRQNNFVLLLDDFNKYDELSIEILKDIIPILQVNGIKIILSEDTGKPIVSDFINNLNVFHLHPFTNEDLEEFIEMSFFKLFPKRNFKSFIAENSDLLPGSIFNLVGDLLFLDCLQFDYKHVKISDKEKNSEIIKRNRDEIYKLRTEGLSNNELKVINLCALFDNTIDIKAISVLTGFNEGTAEDIVSSLIRKGIFHDKNISLNPHFTSAGLRKYVYHNISSKKEFHLSSAEKIIEQLPKFNKIECARQFELAGEYKKCCKVFKNELDSPAAKSNLFYQEKILTKLISHPLDSDDLLEIKYLLSSVLYQLNENSECMDLTNKLLKEKLNADKETELIIQKGKCLIKQNKNEEGINLLNSALTKTGSGHVKQEVNVEIAQAKFDSNDFSTAIDICKKVIEEKQSTEESKAKAYSLIAMVEEVKNNNSAGAIYNYQYAINMYERANLHLCVSLMEMNIGNIIYRKGNLVEAEKHWQASFKANEKTGNLSNEAKILFNYGTVYFYAQSFEKAIEKYQRAESIFSSLGNSLGRGFTLLNMGQVYLYICEYDLALKSLEIAKNIFDKVDKDKYAMVIFSYGQCYFYQGDAENLEAVIKIYENLYHANGLKDNHENNIAFLKILSSFCQEKYSEVIQTAGEVIEYYKNQDDQDGLLYFVKCKMLLIRSLINQKEYDTSVLLLNEKEFSKTCNSNTVLLAERKYLLGMIAEINDESKLKTEADRFVEALHLIENQSILELTWEINYALAKFYYDRGNRKKFIEYSLITKSLINFIASKISSKKMRSRYLNSFSRKSLIEMLENFEKSI